MGQLTHSAAVHSTPTQVPYTVLKPGESKVYRTFAQHAWQARCLETARRM